MLILSPPYSKVHRVGWAQQRDKIPSRLMHHPSPEQTLHPNKKENIQAFLTSCGP